MDAKKYLQQIERYRCRIKNKLEEKSMWMGMATGITSNADGERVQSSGTKDKMSCAVIESVSIDEDIKLLRNQINEIIRTIEGLEQKYYDILHLIYVQNFTTKEIRAYYRKSESWVHDTHKKALKELQKVLDERDK